MPKKIKQRPPRLYTSGDKTYYHKGNKKILVNKQSQNVKITNIISQNAKRRRRVGRPVAAQISKKELEMANAKHRAELSEQKIRAKEAADLMDLRLKQIREAAQTKNEAESLALKKEHEKEAEQLRELKRLENEKARQEIEALRLEAAGQSAEIERLRSAELEREMLQIKADELEDTNLKLNGQLAEVGERASLLVVDKEEKLQRRADQRRARSVGPANLKGLPNADEQKVGKGNKLHVSSLPNGLSEIQINDIMDDDPRYLTTIAADEIHTLADSAKTIDDDYEEFGFIVNLDKRNESNLEHWVAIYFDTEKEKVMFYYDPFGDPPTETVNNGLKELVKKLDLPYYLAAEYNMKKNQNLNSNRCGIHCMQFLHEMFNGKSTDEATERNEQDAMKFQSLFI